MVENDLSEFPNPFTGLTAPCNAGTQAMDGYPDATSVAGSADKQTDPNTPAGTYDPGDKDGYTLFAHDITGNNSQTTTVNYTNFNKTTHCYTADANGTVHQYDLAGVEQFN